ncbi:MAG: hypothetical protein ACKVP3_09345 [Hyphomicrobiaceae bacterium]
MRWSLRSRHDALVAGALLGALSVVPSAVAQQPAQVEFSTFRLFEGDSVDLNRGDFQRLAGTIRNAQTPGNCPVGRLKIRVPEGDPSFQQALVAARRDAVLATLEQLGLRVAGRLFVETDIFGRPEGHDTVYESPRDRTPPTLRTTSNPPKGSKVQPGQRIIVRMAGRDDTDRWQTGVKTIQLVADSEAGRFIVSENYEPCSEPKEKRAEATYTVPADPPPIVRLTALAEDHAGLMDKDIGEFPTGDFYGTFTTTTVSAGQDRFRTLADLVLNHDGRGNLTGTMTGQLEYVAHSTPNCSFRQVQPNRFRVSLVGSLTERSSPAEGATLKVFIGEIEETALTAEARCQGTAGGPIGPPSGWKFKNAAWTPEAFLGTPSALGEGEVLADGTREYKFEHMTSDGGTRWTVTLRRARN